MSRLLDPSICPDCRGTLDPAATCTVCGLRVSGPLALRLWEAMVVADRIIEELRTAPAAQPDLQPETQPEPARGPVPPLPPVTAPTRVTRPRRRRLPAASVPAVLLALGALCLLVAAVVFVAVTWRVLGLTGRTLVLLGITAALSAVAVTLTRKALRAAAETMWLVVAGMLTVDLLGAQSAGLLSLDSLGWRGTGALVGGALAAMGTSVALWVRRQELQRLYGAEVVSVIGATLLCWTNAWFAADRALACTIAVPLLAAAAMALRRPLPLAAYGLGGLGVATWAALLGTGWGRALETVTLGTWWADLRGWPLLAAAVLGAAAAQAPHLPEVSRPTIAGFSLVPLVLLANAPQGDAMPTRDLLIACATLVGLALLAALAPRPWGRGAAALTALGLLFTGVWLIYRPWNVLTYLQLDGLTDLRLPLTAPSDASAPWTAMMVAAAGLVAAVCLLPQVPVARRRTAALAVRSVAPAAVALGALVLVLELEPPLWSGALAAALATAIAGGAAWWARDHGVAAWAASAATAYLVVLTCDLALAARLLTALTTTALVAALLPVAVLRARAAAQPSTSIVAGLAALAGGWAATAWGAVMEVGVTDRALALSVYAGAVGVLALPLARRTFTRVALEGSSAALALVALAVADRNGGDSATAMVLTIVGTAVCIIAVSSWDRALLDRAGVAVLGAATVLRVTAEVDAPELYTLPAALLLIAVGALRLRQDPASSSFSVLGSGLVLALLPSLLLALEDPVTLRGVLVGVAAVLVLAVGLQLRLSAPFVLGALTTAVLALRHLQPVADAVPRWLSLGGVGVALLVVGVTWEARRNNVATAQRYLTALR